MTIQKQIQQYYRDCTNPIGELRLCVAKPLPQAFNFAENHPGTILYVVVDREQGKPIFKIGFSNQLLIEFEEFEENDELTHFLSHVFLFDPIAEENVEPFYFEVFVQRRFYEDYLLGEPVYMEFMKGRIKRLALIHETENELRMIMECKRISVFFSFARAYSKYCAEKLHFIKNQPELNDYLSNCINTSVDLAEYDFFHK